MVLVGSSMGGWLMLLVGLALGERLKGLVGIAAAPDFTRWAFNGEQRARLQGGHTLFAQNPYGPDPTPTHALFFNDADQLTMLDDGIAITCPVRLLHGQEDEDVPPEIALRLAASLDSEDVQVTLIKGGGHRLSRISDVALLKRTVAAIG